MPSAKNRLEQLSQHVAGSDAPRSSRPEPDVLCEIQTPKPGAKVAVITFFNPDKLNVASAELLNKLISICKSLSKDQDLRAVILTGARPRNPDRPAAFIGGADVHELSQISNSEEARTYITRVHNACAAVSNVPVPVIARVNGFALGAGMELMASCDLKIATKSSRFGMPEVKIGLPSLVEAALFPRQIGAGRTRRLLYLAETLNAETAQRWGLIERMVEDEEELDRAVDEWVSMIVGMAPKNLRLQKRLIRKWENGTLEEGILAGVDAIAETYEDGGQEAKEYMEPFLGGKGKE